MEVKCRLSGVYLYKVCPCALELLMEIKIVHLSDLELEELKSRVNDSKGVTNNVTHIEVTILALNELHILEKIRQGAIGHVSKAIM